jgi:hypothetical protein
MTTFAKKINLSVAAVAMVGAAVLAPSIAQATPSLPLAPTADADDDAGVGGAAGKSPRRAARGAAERNAAASDAGTPSARAGARANATGSNPLLQNSLWWFGTPNPAPPTPLYTRTFNPLANLPEWTLPSYGWYRNLNFEACVLGLGTTITPSVGPYGTSTNSVSTGGC